MRFLTRPQRTPRFSGSHPMFSTSARRGLVPALVGAALLSITAAAVQAEPLPNTQPLEEKGDLAAKMVEGIGKYLDREAAASIEKRKPFWKPDFSSPEAFAKSVQPNRERLKKILGVVDERVKFADIEYVG